MRPVGAGIAEPDGCDHPAPALGIDDQQGMSLCQQEAARTLA
jgi:hypothetical protein